MTAGTLAALLARARSFHDDDPDPETRAELAALLAQPDAAQLAERFAGPLEFGTAGLRGVLGAGESRMNERVVAQTTAGLCAALTRTVPNAKTRGLCIGFDGRRKSRDFADVAAEIAAGAGFVVHRFDDVVPTPLLAFSVVDCQAAAGVMITASHNPPQYNGYKVYWENGAQIIPPEDIAIAQQIAAAGPVLALPRLDLQSAAARALICAPSGSEARYLAAVRSAVGVESSASALRIAYTALHGVGERLALRVLHDAGFANVFSVPEQAEPNGAFPTVAFPNPEEHGAMDLVLALAREKNADLVLANDPDADRLAIAARTKDGSIVQLTGNEAGLLFAEHLLEHAPRDGKSFVLASLVSTPLLARVASAHGARCEFTLTGFKWIANRALELERGEGLRFLLGFEEALGLCVGGVVRDKDGISAGVLAARIAAQHARNGHTLLDALEALYRKHGLYESAPVSITLPGHDGMAKMVAAMNALRTAPPTALAELRVVGTIDLERGTETRDGSVRPATLPQSNVLIYELEGEHRICVRPSGTEPKLKLYVDAFTRVDASESLPVARARARQIAERIGRALLRVALP